MAKILLAHARMDRIAARRLAGALREGGHLPWLVEDELCLGESFAGALVRGLQDTNAVLECLSSAAVSSGWTAFEAGLLKEHAPEQVQVLRVRFEEVGLPEAAASREGIDLFPGEKGWRAGVARILRAVDGAPGASTPALASPPPNNLPRRLVPFVGREQALAWLREQLIPEGAPTHSKRAIVYGRAGEGKSALAREFAERHVSLYPGGIWWLRAGSVPFLALDGLAGELRKHAPPMVREALEAIPTGSTGEEEARAVIRALEANPQPSLLILDDVALSDEVTAWAGYLPAGQVSVLMTSRRRSPGLPEAAWEVGPFTTTEARELLERLGPLLEDSSETAARERLLHAWLRRSPLLIALGAAALRARGLSWRELEQEFLREAREDPPSESAPGKPAATRAVDALDLCIERLGTRELTRRLLEGASIFAPELEVPLEWVIPTGLGLEVGGQPVSQDIRDALQSLERMGLLSLRNGSVFLLGTVRERVSALMPAAYRELAVLRGLGCVTSWLRQTAQPGAPWEAVEARRPHIEEVLRLSEPSAHATVWVLAAGHLAQHLMRRGAREPARSLLLRAMRGSVRWSGGNEEWLVANRWRVISTLLTNGDTDFARRLLMQAIHEDPAWGLVDPAHRAKTLAEFAALLCTSGAWDEALEFSERALSIDRVELGGGHELFPERLALRARLANMVGDFRGALSFCEEALAIGEKVFGPGDVRLASILETLALTMDEGPSGTERFLPLLERALALRETTQGASHLETIRLMADVARIYNVRGERVKARVHAERAMSLLEVESRPLDLLLVSTLITLLGVFDELGDTPKARALLERATCDLERLEAPDSSRVLLSWQLSKVCQKYGKVLDAERLRARARVLAASCLPESNPLLRVLGDELSVSGGPVPSALRLLLPQTADGAGAEALQRGLHLFSRGDVPHETKHEALRDALATARRMEDPANGARALYLLADLEGRQGAWEQARDDAREGLQLALRAGVPVLVAEGYRLLGDAALHGSYYEDARMNYEEAIRRYDELGERHRASSTRLLLVTLLLQLGRRDAVASHVSWMRERLLQSDLLEEERRDLMEVLALAERRLSPREKGGRASGP